MTSAERHEVHPDVRQRLRTAPERIPGSEVIAAFDFDGTLTRGGSVWRFLSYVVGRHAVVRAGVSLAGPLSKAAVVGGAATDEAKEALFLATLAGLRADQVAERAEAFGPEHYHARARTEVRARIDWHRNQGHVLLLVSASPELYVAPVGEELGFDGVLATRLEIDDEGLLTGHYLGRNCRAAEKLARLEQWVGDLFAEADTAARPEPGHESHDRAGRASRVRAGGADAAGGGPRRPGGAMHAKGPGPGERPFLWAYGNSAGDRELLAAADIGIDAGRLGRFGRLRRFRRLGDVLTAW